MFSLESNRDLKEDRQLDHSKWGTRVHPLAAELWLLTVGTALNSKPRPTHTDTHNCGPIAVRRSASPLMHSIFSPCLRRSNIQASSCASTYPFCSAVHLHHVVLSSSVHVGQFLETRSPLSEAVVVLVSAAGRVQRRQASCFRAASFVVKHQQGVIGGRCWVIVSCLQVLRRDQRMFSMLSFYTTCTSRQERWREKMMRQQVSNNIQVMTDC